MNRFGLALFIGLCLVGVSLAEVQSPDADADALRFRLNTIASEHNGNIPTEDLLALWKEFPAAPILQMLIDWRIRETADPKLRKQLLVALRDTAGVAEPIRTLAIDILAGRVRPLSTRVGEKLPLKFEAIDGRKVDISKLRGRVVLVDFWATWCGPCVAGMPEVKRVYDEYHPRGFEIIGISFDEQRSRLETFIQQAEMPWPQYFDGGFDHNRIGNELEVRVLPTMILLDKKGVLRSVSARGDLAHQVEKLLSE